MRTAIRVSAMQLVGMLVVWVATALIPRAPFGAEVPHPSVGTSATRTDMVLTVDEGLLSLKAQNASMKGIFEAIGQQLSIDVVARISEDERITIAFEQLSLAGALKRFRPYVNYVVLEDTTKAPGAIRKLIVISKHAAGVSSRPTTREGEGLALPAPSQREAPTPGDLMRPKPFTFEFDPSTIGERKQ
jgi:hypothetical protein